MRGLPSGTVTLLFTDIAGSTRLLEELGGHYADALAEHRRLLRATFDGHGGVEVDTQGDAFFVAFEKASDALAAAVDAQTALTAQGPIRARIGIHTGEPVPTEEGYVGIDVHRAARIAAAGHGGQILLSQSTRQLVDRGDLRDLGEHRLKDVGDLRLYQVGDETFAPLKTLSQTNLPLPPTPPFGPQAGARRPPAPAPRQVVPLVPKHSCSRPPIIGGSRRRQAPAARAAAGACRNDQPLAAARSGSRFAAFGVPRPVVGSHPGDAL